MISLPTLIPTYQTVWNHIPEDLNVNVANYLCFPLLESWDSLVSIGTGYGLDDQGVGVRVPTGSRNFLLRSVHTGSKAHPASYPMGTRGPFPGGKATGA
jgi:hypothetical protein